MTQLATALIGLDGIVRCWQPVLGTSENRWNWKPLGLKWDPLDFRVLPGKILYLRGILGSLLLSRTD
jgi:hypothetical protein